MCLMGIDNRVFHAASTLLQRGIKPSGRKVRAFLGGGSDRDIAPALARWWATEAVKAPSLSVANTSDLVPRAEMEAALALAEERLEAQRRHVMLETDRIRQEMGEPLRRQIEKLASENFLLKNRVAALERERR